MVFFNIIRLYLELASFFEINSKEINEWKNIKKQKSHKCLPDKTYRNWIFLSPPHPPQMHNCPCQSATKFTVLMIIELPEQRTLLTSTPILLRIIIIVVWLIVPPSLSNPSKPFFRESTWFKNIYHLHILIKSHETTDTLYFKIQRCFGSFWPPNFFGGRGLKKVT